MKKRVSKFDIGVYASGELFGGGTVVLFSFFYLIFLTDVVGLRPASAGLILLIVRVWDAFSDPVMGYITDNTRTRIGRRRPYFIAGFFAVIASWSLLWHDIGSTNQTTLFIYVLFANLFYTTVNTMVNVPYIAMGAEISNNARDRDLANGSKMIVSQLASLVAAVIPLSIVAFFADEAMGYRVMGFSFAILFAIPFLLMGIFVKEVNQDNVKKQPFKWSDFLIPFKVKSFNIFVLMFLLSTIAMNTLSTIFAYFMKYSVGRSDELTLVLGTMLLAQTFVVPLVIKLARKIGKPAAYRLFTLIWIIGSLSLIYVTNGAPDWFMYVASAIIGFGIGGAITLVYMMFPDAALITEAVTKKSNTGTVSGVVSFTRKLAGALAAFFVTMILELTGYLNPIKEQIDGVVVNTEQVQPEIFISSLNVMMVLIPLFIAIVSYYVSKLYKADNHLLDHLTKYLDFQRGDINEPELTTDESRLLLEKL